MSRHFDLHKSTDWSEWSRDLYGNIYVIFREDVGGFQYPLVKRRGQWTVSDEEIHLKHAASLTCARLSELISSAKAENLTREEVAARAQEAANKAAIDRENTVFPKFDKNKTSSNLEDYYPRLSRKKRESGSVIVGVYVNEEGMVVDVKVNEGCRYPTLNEAALQYARTMIFTPGTFYGKQAAMWHEVRISFE